MKFLKQKNHLKKTITEEISNFNPIESIQSIFTGGSNSQNSKSSTASSVPITSTQSKSPIIFETLSLSTKTTI